MKIDAHQHFWNYEPTRHEWIDESMSILRRDFSPVDLAAIYKKHDIDGCIAVQADQSIEENTFLLELAERHDFIKGVVGWVDLRASDIKKQLDFYSNNNLMKGFRHIVQGEVDPNFLLRSSFMSGISKLEQYGFTYDILVFPHQLGAVLELVKKLPNQKFVIDHLAKPYIKDGYFDGWATMMKAIAKHENVYCKLSGMVTEADHKHWTSQELERYMTLILEAFGTKRIMFGSDWPVCLLAANYGEVKALVANFISSLSVAEQEDFWSNNAINFYNIS